jgi:hypothetical protein
MEENLINNVDACKTSGEVLHMLDGIMKKNSVNYNLTREYLIKAGDLAGDFEDYRSLYLFSYFSVYPKIWPDFRWVDSLMESALTQCINEKQTIVLLKDAAFMGRSYIVNKIKTRLGTTRTTTATK